MTPSGLPSPYAFRPAVADDVPSLIALIDSAYRGDPSRAGWTTEADLLDGQRTDAEEVAAAIGGAANRMLVVQSKDEIIACCQLEHRDAYAYFGMFAVRPKLQGAGLGKALLAEAERFARHVWAATEMHMTVISAREDLIDWYVRRGYARTGKMSPFPYGNERFGRPLRNDLIFELLVKELGPEPRQTAP